MTEHMIHFVNEESNDCILDAAERHGLDLS